MCAGVLLEFERAGFCQQEAGHHVWHNHERVAVDFANVLLTVGRVAYGDHGIGVCVVNKLVRQQCVQN